MKRGVVVLQILFGLLIVMIVTLVFFRIAYSYGSNEAFLRHNMAENTALAVNALEAAPGNVLLVIPQNITGYVVILENKQAIISDKELEKSGQTLKEAGRYSFPFVPSNRTDTKGTKEDVTYVTLEKNKKDIGFK